MEDEGWGQVAQCTELSIRVKIQAQGEAVVYSRLFLL